MSAKNQQKNKKEKLERWKTEQTCRADMWSCPNFEAAKKDCVTKCFALFLL